MSSVGSCESCDVSCYLRDLFGGLWPHTGLLGHHLITHTGFGVGSVVGSRAHLLSCKAEVKDPACRNTITDQPSSMRDP